MRLIKNPLLDVLPARGGLELRVAACGRSLSCTPLQASLLETFGDACDLDEALAGNPRLRRDRAFVDAAIAAGILLPVDERGRAVIPDVAGPVHERFLGAPSPAAAQSAHADVTFAFLGVPWDRDVSGRAGARFGPSAVRAASQAWPYSIDPLSRRPHGWYDVAARREVLAGVGFCDAGDVVVMPGDQPDVVRARMARAVEQILVDDLIPLVVGGDHSITRPVITGVIDAMRRHEHDDAICIVHFDAHTDLGDTNEGDDGRLLLHHGNVMRVILDECSRVQRIVQVGLRGLISRNHRAGHERVSTFGIDEIDDVDAIIEQIPEECACWFSVDIDVVDPAFAPSTGTPVPGGMLPRELFRLIERIASERVCLGIDVVEVAEPRDAADGTAGIAATCLMRFAHGIVEAHRAAGAEDAEPEPDDR